ncbi:MAG: c-type cytochrome [Mariprofundaceae bacterium]|nr:c-type cytochrome [Mariprofundaceae bacterium]
MIGLIAGKGERGMEGLIRAGVGLMLALAFSLPLTAEEFTPDASRGEKTFQTICAHCHNITYDESRVGSPGLKGVLERHDEKWLHQWLKGPEAFAKVDETAATLIESNKYKIKMPTFPQMQDDQHRADMIEYLKTLKGD